ncbi:tetratricopeptide repeat protein [Amazonocrinis nigriterrae]|uniref:tetratricopeptide repeat protein n=1 Tax=Amazonocrinis nigriterrae TaxID=2840443 RepID=UPI00298EFB94|nr:tetratricopeptide repeat protein [Amazonocrinis nigriterrae]
MATLSTSFVLNLPIVFTASQVLAQTTDERKAEAQRLSQQGIQQLNTGQFQAALQSFQQALIIYQEIKDRKGEGQSLGNLGLIYFFLGEYTKAIDYHQQDLVIAREFNDRLGEGQALGNLGLAYYVLGNYGKAIEYEQQHLTIARQINHRQGESNALGNLGSIYLAQGDYAKAVEYLQQVLLIARELQDSLSEGKALANLGLAYIYQSDFTQGLDFLEKSLILARKIQDRQTEGMVIRQLGNIYINQGDYSKGIDYLQKSLKIAQEIQEPNGEASAFTDLGGVFLRTGDYDRAIDYFQQSLTIARQIKNPHTEVNSLMSLGLGYFTLGDYARANDYLQSGLQIAHNIPSLPGEAGILNNLGLISDEIGQPTQAIEYHQQSLIIARKIKDLNTEGKALGNLGLAYFELGDYGKAIDYQQQWLAIARRVRDRESEGKTLGNLGNIYAAQQNYTKGIEYQQQWLAIAREIKDTTSESAALNNLGNFFYKSGNFVVAEKSLLESIGLKESFRGGLDDSAKVSIFDIQSHTYQTLQQVLIAQNKTDAALEIAERGRARAFVELISSRLNNNNGETKPKSPTIDQIKEIAKLQNSTLVQYSIIGDDFQVAGKKQFKESELYIWVVKPTGEVTFRKANLKPLWQKDKTNLDELVITSRESIGTRGRGIFDISYNPNAPKAENNLKRLHELLIKPIADVLPTKASDKVIFIPQGSLFLVPFPALQDENGQYLIEKHTILTSPSIQVLQLTRQQRNLVSGKDALVVGNPTMPKFPPKIGEPPRQLPALPGAEKEAKAIAPLLKTQPLIGKQATKSAVLQLLPKARIIHLATHGLLDDIQGLNSAIALTPSGKDNGLLTANEIFDLKLNAELVVLSACDTGRGRITGDGVIGLSRSLISAGVPSVMVSLWSVPDAPTASLMTEFYQNLQKNPDKAQALRQAMLITMKQHPNPRDWAAFTLIGEAE